MVWAVQGKTYQSWAPRVAIAVVVAVVGLVLGLQEVQKAQFDPETAKLVNHQTQGLLDPAHSTAGGHFSMAGGGLLQMFTNPIGLGLGATTLAAGKFGGNATSSEMDFSDLFLSLGVVGGALYLALMYAILRMCFQHWQKTRHIATLAVIGLLATCLAHWLTGGAYMLCTLLWFAVGTIDRAHKAQQPERSAA